MRGRRLLGDYYAGLASDTSALTEILLADIGFPH